MGGRHVGAEEWSRAEGSSEGKLANAAKMICKTEGGGWRFSFGAWSVRSEMLVKSVLHLAVDVALAKLLFPVGLQGQAGLFREQAIRLACGVGVWS